MNQQISMNSIIKPQEASYNPNLKKQETETPKMNFNKNASQPPQSLKQLKTVSINSPKRVSPNQSPKKMQE